MIILSVEEIISQKELADLGLSVADGNSQYKDILMWIREHRI